MLCHSTVKTVICPMLKNLSPYCHSKDLLLWKVMPCMTKRSSTEKQFLLVFYRFSSSDQPTPLEPNSCQKWTSDFGLQSQWITFPNYWVVQRWWACQNGTPGSYQPQNAFAWWLPVFPQSYAKQKGTRWWDLLVCGLQLWRGGQEQKCYSRHCL